MTNHAIAYVDGSYDNISKSFSYGVVLLVDGKTITHHQRFDSHPAADMRNVAGEIAGAMAAMKFCTDHNIEKLTIYHDYIGIAAWCTGAWKAKNAYTQAYRAFYQKTQKTAAVRFEKVAAHSGDKYNDLADKLAREALGK